MFLMSANIIDKNNWLVARREYTEQSYDVVYSKIRVADIKRLAAACIAKRYGAGVHVAYTDGRRILMINICTGLACQHTIYINLRIC